MKIDYVTGKSVFKNRITKQKPLSTKALFRKLSKPIIRKDKDGDYLILATFSSNIRNANNLLTYTGAVIDVDDTTQDMQSIADAFTDYKCCIHTTHSHMAPNKGQRYRVVIPYKKPLTPKQHVAAILYLMSKIGDISKRNENVDTSSKALSRPMYLPACPKSRKKHFQYYNNLTDQPDAKLFHLTPDMEFELQELSDQNNSDDLQDPFDPTQSTDEGDRNNAIARYTGKLISQGHALDDILSMCHSYNEHKVNPPLPPNEVKTVVTSVYNTHKTNHNDSGWGYEEIFRRIDEAKSREVKRNANYYLKLIGKSRQKLGEMNVDILLTMIAEKSRTAKSKVKTEYRLSLGEVKEEETREETNTHELTAKELKKKFKTWCYVSSEDRVYETNTGSMIKPEGFNNEFSQCIEKGSILKYLLKFKLIKIVRNKEFSPGDNLYFKRNGIRYVNSYVTPDVSPLPGDVEPMEKHFEYLFENEIERNILLDWIAFLIQYPGVKVKWMPIIKGWKGIGKSIIEEKIITPMLGYSNVRSVESRFVKSDFNAWVLDRQLIVFHELKLGESRREKLSLTNSLKSIITDHTIEAHRKGLDVFTVTNKVNLLGFTNHEDSVMITEDERRFCMIRSDAIKMPTSYYTELVNWLEHNVEHMLYYFEERDLTHFNASIAPDTGYTSEVKSESHLWPASIIKDAMEDSNNFLAKDGIATWSNIVEYIREHSSGQDIMQAENLTHASSSQGYRLTNALKELGFRRWRRKGVVESCKDRMRINGKLQYVWIAPHVYDEVMNMTPKQIREILKTQKFIGDFK